MPSIRKREANRNNAKRSTGPRSVQGKLIAKRNALRHGLAAQPAISLQSERMARAICGMGASRLQYEDALNIAESHFLVQAVRIARIAAIKRVTTVTRTLKQHVADSFELPPERAAQTTSEEQSSPKIEDDLNAFEQALALQLQLPRLFRSHRLAKGRLDQRLPVRQTDQSDTQKSALGTWQHASFEDSKYSSRCRCYGCTGRGTLFAR